MRVLGVDLGGSRLRAVLRKGSERLRRVRRAKPGPEELPSALREIAGRRKLDGLVIGARGVWTPSETSALRRRLSPLARRVKVLSDVELAWRAALGGAAGIVVIAGTGSIAFGKNAAGRRARAGGLGPLLGDEGSSFWIGREWLRTRPESVRRAYAVRPDSVRAIAALAPAALKARPRLAREAGDRLARLARECSARLRLSGEVPVSWGGGLFAHPGVRRAFLRSLGSGFSPRPPLESAEECASKLLP